MPLLPGYGPEANIRSSAPPKRGEIQTKLSEAEENGYQDSYFAHRDDGYMSSPNETRNKTTSPTPPTPHSYTSASEPEVDHYVSASENEGGPWSHQAGPTITSPSESSVPSVASTTAQAPALVATASVDFAPPPPKEADDAEVVFFDYGVVVFFGFTEVHEKAILEDIHNAGVVRRKIHEVDWEIEECHFTVCLPALWLKFFALTFNFDSMIPTSHTPEFTMISSVS